MKKKTILIGIFVLTILIFSNCARNEKSAVHKIEKIIFESGIKTAIEKIEKLKSESGGSLNLSENDVISLGSILLNADKTDEAIKIFTISLEMFPESKQTHFNLSLAYKNNNNRELEIEHFQKFTQLRFKERADQIIKNLDNPPATSVEEVIERCLNVMGGKERFQSINTMIVKSRAVNIGRNPIITVRYYKRPGLFRQETIPNNNSFTVVNAKGVWRIRNGVWKEIEGELRENYLHASTIDHEFINYREKGITYDFLGIVGIRNAAFYKIKKTFKSGSTDDLFINVETNLLEMEYHPNSNGIHRTNFYDYRNRNGILIHHVSAVSSATLLFPPYVILTEDVKINVPIDDSLFVKSK